MNKNINKPLVSVLMPVYNAERFLSSALDSVLNQNFVDFELICLDDGSTDASYGILKGYARNDERIRIYKNRKNMGIGYTRKRLLGLARAGYLAIMDADDIMFPNRLFSQYVFLKTHNDVVVVGGQCVTIDSEGKATGRKIFPTDWKRIYNTMFTHMSVQQPATMINRKRIPRDFIWYDNTVSPVEDLDVLFRLFNFGKFANLSEDVLYYREYNHSSSLRDPKRTFWLTKLVRERAVSEYGYKVTLYSRLTSFIQSSIIFALPSSLIFPLYLMFRNAANSYAVLRNLPSMFSIPRVKPALS